MLNYYKKPLATRVDDREEILAGSLEEIEIRAATKIVVERLVQEDWCLWQTGEKLQTEGKLRVITR